MCRKMNAEQPHDHVLTIPFKKEYVQTFSVNVLVKILHTQLTIFLCFVIFTGSGLSSVRRRHHSLSGRRSGPISRNPWTKTRRFTA